SIQHVSEDIVSRIVRGLARNYHGIDNLCLAGGVALNCVINGRLLKEGYFRNIWVQPASGDSGGALGAALAAHYIHHKKTRDVFFGEDSMKGGFLGPSFSDESIETALKAAGAKFSKVSDICGITALALTEQRAI